jgi:hypothetical protein
MEADRFADALPSTSAGRGRGSEGVLPALQDRALRSTCQRPAIPVVEAEIGGQSKVMEAVAQAIGETKPDARRLPYGFGCAVSESAAALA